MGRWGKNYMGAMVKIFVIKNGEYDMKKKLVICLELQRGQVSYEKIRVKDSVK